MLESFFGKGISPAYKKKKATNKRRKMKLDSYAESDSRASDNNKALFTDKYPEKKIGVEEDYEVVIDLTKKRKLVEEEVEGGKEEFLGNLKETDLVEMIKNNYVFPQLSKYFEGQATIDNEMFEEYNNTVRRSSYFSKTALS